MLFVPQENALTLDLLTRLICYVCVLFSNELLHDFNYTVDYVALWKNKLQIQIRWLHQKPSDQDLQCFDKRIHLGSAGQGFILCLFDVCLSFLSSVSQWVLYFS